MNNDKMQNLAIEDPNEAELDHADDCTLFIGDLSRTVNEQELQEYFSKFGEIASLEIKRDRITQASLGYAFVIYKTRKQAADAKANLHRTVIGNRAIRIGWAQKNTNLFVGDLDPSITTEMLRETFRVFGPICEEETFVKHANYGFVKFKHRADAERAKREMDGKLLGNRQIRLGWGESNTQRNCVHIQFNAEEAENLTQEDIRKRFEEFGEVVSVHLPRNEKGELRGYAFVHFEESDEGEDSSSRAIAELNNSVLGQVVIKCHFGKKQHKGTKTQGKKYRYGGGHYQKQVGWQQVPYVFQQYYPIPSQGNNSNDSTYPLYNQSATYSQQPYFGYASYGQYDKKKAPRNNNNNYRAGKDDNFGRNMNPYRNKSSYNTPPE